MTEKDKKDKIMIIRKTGVWITAVLLVLTLAVSGCGRSGSDSKKETAESSAATQTSSEKEIEEKKDKESGGSILDVLRPDEEKEEESSDISKTEETQDPSVEAVPQVEPETVTQEPAETPAVTEAAAPSVSAADLIILNDPWEYYYSDLVSDSRMIAELYSGLVTVDSIGTTADGRELWHFVVGNPNAEKEVFINGTTHAREYLTTQLVMKQMAVYLQHVANGDFYGDVSYQDMWDQVAIHVVPCVNPDGMTLSQFGLSGMNYESTIQAIYEIAAMDGTEINDYYLNTWKANALGTDINRNYDALWEEYIGAGHPSSEMYKGEYPGSSIEAAAMIDLTLNNHFLRTISYHTQGSVIYWNFYNVENFFDEAYGFASALSAATGYYLWDDYQGIDALAYSDWGNYRCSIPSVTVECGYGEPPYMQDQFQTIWAQNINVWEVTVLSVM